MTDTNSEEQTRLQRFWLAEMTLFTARRLAAVSAVFAIGHTWLFWRGSSVSPVFLFTVVTVSIVLTWISVMSWVIRRKHNRLIAE